MHLSDSEASTTKRVQAMTKETESLLHAIKVAEIQPQGNAHTMRGLYDSMKTEVEEEKSTQCDRLRTKEATL